MPSPETLQTTKEPGVRSPGMRAIPIRELNYGQAAKLIGCELTRFPKKSPADEDTWRLDFLDPETSGKANARILIRPESKVVELIITTSNGQHVNLALHNTQTVDLINYGGEKAVIFRSRDEISQRGMLLVNANGKFSGDGLDLQG